MKRLINAIKNFFTKNIGIKLLALALGILTVFFINL